MTNERVDWADEMYFSGVSVLLYHMYSQGLNIDIDMTGTVLYGKSRPDN